MRPRAGAPPLSVALPVGSASSSGPTATSPGVRRGSLAVSAIDCRYKTHSPPQNPKRRAAALSRCGLRVCVQIAGRQVGSLSSGSSAAAAPQDCRLRIGSYLNGAEDDLECVRINAEQSRQSRSPSRKRQLPRQLCRQGGKCDEKGDERGECTSEEVPTGRDRAVRTVRTSTSAPGLGSPLPHLQRDRACEPYGLQCTHAKRTHATRTTWCDCQYPQCEYQYPF
jgi:hypothetical protein